MRDRMLAALKAAHEAGDTAAATRLAQAIRGMDAPEAAAPAAPEPAAPSGPVVSPEALASVGLGGERPAARVAGLSLDPAQMAADILPPAFEYQDTADGRIRLFPGSEAAGMAAIERAKREQAYQEGQAARAQYEAALNPASPADAVMHQTGALYSSTGDSVTGVGKVVQDAWNTALGQPVTDFASLFGEADFTMRSNPLEWYGDRIGRFGETLQEGTGEGYKQLLADNVWGGDVDDRSTWTLGDNPSITGQAERFTEAAMSLFPTLLAAYATQGRALPPALVGGGMAGAGAQDQAEDQIRQMHADGELYERSERYRELLATSVYPADALEQLIAEVREGSFYPAAAVGGLGGAATSKIMNPANRLFGRMALPGRALAMGAASGTEEAVQEWGEGAATNAAVNIAAGTDIPLNEGSFANVIGGLGAGGPTGAGGAVATHRVTSDQVRLQRAHKTLLDPSAPIGDRMAAAMELDAAGFTVGEESITPADPNRDYRAETTAGSRAPVGAVAQDMAAMQTPTRLAYGEVPERDPEAEAQAIVGGALASRGPQTTFDITAEVEPPAAAPPVMADATANDRSSVPFYRPSEEVAPGEPTEARAAAAPKAAPSMQNRDRSRPASVAQMQEIRKNPDAARLGFSRDSNTGAPMVSHGQEVPAGDLGRVDTVVMPDGRRVPVQYAVVEADAVQASNFADGQVNPAYDGAPLQALNNGRTAGVQAAWQSGTADAYRAGLVEDAVLHGVAPEAIASKRQPMLVRLYDPAENLTGAESNAAQQLGLSPVEQANTDAESLPDLSGLTWNEDGSIPVSGNAEFFRAWFRNMGATESATLQDAQGRPNAAAVQRLRTAMIGRAYGDERLLSAVAEDVNPDNRNILNALARAAGGFAALDQNDPLARDVRASIVGGLELVREAQNQGQSLESLLGQGDLLGRDPNAAAVARFMAANTRSAARMAEAFRAIADYTGRAQSQAASLDIFGGPPPPTAREAINAAGIETDTGPSGEDAGGRSGGGEPSASGRAEAADTRPAGSPETGLFGAPTAREQVDGEARRRADARDGRTGAVTPSFSGTPLGATGAGAAPAQADVEGAASSHPLYLEGMEAEEKYDRAITAEEAAGLERELEARGYIPDRIQKPTPKRKRQHTNWFAPRGLDVPKGTSFHVNHDGNGAWRLHVWPKSELADADADEDGGMAEQRDDDAPLYDDSEITADADAERDELRRRRKAKTKKKSGPLSVTRDEAPLAYELDIFLDNGYTELDVSDMTPQGKATVAARIVKQTFGFASVGVANDLNTLTAINQLTFAYRNLQSMAAIMAWPSEAIGKLSPNLLLERGDARGALASYSPGERTIRLSEQHDAFAHEFGHALDWWVWQTMKQVDPATGEPKGRAATGKLKLGGELTNIPVMDAFLELNEAMFSENGDAAVKIASLEKNILVQRNKIAALQDRADRATDPDRVAKIEEAIKKRQAHITRLARQITDIKAKPKPNYKADSDYYLNARLLDKEWGMDGGGADEGYWQRPTEMFARAYEAWVANRIETAGGATEFLGRTDAGYLQTSVDLIAKAYPQHTDRDRIFAAMDALMDALRDDVIHGLDGKPLAELKSPDPLPTAAYASWIPHQPQPLSPTRLIKGSMEAARRQMERLAKSDEAEKQARQRVRDGLNPEGKAVVDVTLRAHHWQRQVAAAHFASIGGVLRSFEAKYPQSDTIKQVSRIFASHIGSGELRGETYEDHRARLLNTYGARIGAHARKHGLDKWSTENLRLLRDAMVDHREGADRPAYPDKVRAAALDLRTFLNELWQDARNQGIEFGYTKNGYLPRIVDESVVSGDQAGFLAAAGKVYSEVFESEVGTLKVENLGAISEAARAALGNDAEARALAGLLNKAARAEAAGNKDAAEAAIDEAMDLLHGGLYERVREAWSREAAHDWMNRILGVVASNGHGTEGSQGSFMKSRALPPSADIILGNYMVTDPLELIGTYTVSVANKLTFERFIPKIDGKPDASPVMRLNSIRARLNADQVLTTDAEEIMKSVELITGMFKTSMTRAGLRRMAWVQATYTPVVLGRAMLSQLWEPGTVGLVTKNPADIASMFKTQASDVAAMIGAQMTTLRAIPGIRQVLDRADARSAWAHEFAAWAGAVSDNHFDYIMANRTNLLYGNPRAATKNSVFYRYSGIHPHTMSLRRAAVERSVHYLKRIAVKAQKGSTAAKRDLNDLGIDSTDAALVKYLAETMSTRPTVQEMQASPHAQAVMVAVNRFVDRVSQNPKMVDKPRHASTPERAYMYVVMAFSSAFTQNIVMAEARRLRARWNNEGRLAAAALGIGMGVNLSIFMAGHAMQYLLRVFLYSGGFGAVEDELERWEADPMEGFLTVLTRSGLATFAGDPVLNAIGGFKYDRALTEMGAGAYLGKAVGWISNVGRRAARNSPGTNNAEHAMIREGWDGVAAPLIAHYILTRIPWATPALGWTSSPALKETVADALVGPRKKRGKASEKATDTGRQGRQNVRRGGGRGGAGRGKERGGER